MNISRLVNKKFAKTIGAFWETCPLCGKQFGGHEAGGVLLDTETTGRYVCSDCGDNAKELNKEKFGKG